MAIVTELTSLTTAIKSSILEVQVLSQIIKYNKCNNNQNKLRIVLKQAVQIQEKK